MIENITLAIPFYNTSRYFLECINYSIDNDFVSEIIVNDDFSTEEEWKNLNIIISQLNNNKIKLYRNQTNLGGFKNKYKTVSLASSEWVYLLDSDNYLDQNTLDIISKIENIQNNICYCPEICIIIDDNKNIHKECMFTFPSDKSYSRMGISEIKNELFKNRINCSMFLNDGNYLVNKKEYLNMIDNLDIGEEQTSAADCIAFQYNWMNSGNYSKVVPGFKYFHRIRSDSYWMRSSSSAQSIATRYENMFMYS